MPSLKPRFYLDFRDYYGRREWAVFERDDYDRRQGLAGKIQTNWTTKAEAKRAMASLKRNPSVVRKRSNPLPSHWTPGKVRVNARGEVQVMLTGKAAKQAVARENPSRRRSKSRPLSKAKRIEYAEFTDAEFRQHLRSHSGGRRSRSRKTHK